MNLYSTHVQSQDTWQYMGTWPRSCKMKKVVAKNQCWDAFINMVKKHLSGSLPLQYMCKVTWQGRFKGFLHKPPWYGWQWRVQIMIIYHLPHAWQPQTYIIWYIYCRLLITYLRTPMSCPCLNLTLQDEFFVSKLQTSLDICQNNLPTLSKRIHHSQSWLFSM